MISPNLYVLYFITLILHNAAFFSNCVQMMIIIIISKIHLRERGGRGSGIYEKFKYL